ncbi:unnamed protein product [Darwinula stevensoni]|uniref:Uncharacterized protein n=1 Tax=Darwinula stevensoni TaxID=69355 RepID=A0A7R9A873_9CRUS|nr:unnamed protein product [Darwinula stevensoni]CAG0896051.1 unnamed protein product [Darwinula stevensoni]
MMEFSRLFAVIVSFNLIDQFPMRVDVAGFLVSALALLMLRMTVGHPLETGQSSIRAERSAIAGARAHPDAWAHPSAWAHPDAGPLADAEADPSGLYSDPPGGRRRHNFGNNRNHGIRTADHLGGFGRRR